MRCACLLALLLAVLPACENPPITVRDSPQVAEPAPPEPPAPPPPVVAAPEAPPLPPVVAASEAPPADEGPPPLERAGEPRDAARLRVLVLSGGGYHDFTSNLSKLLPAVAALAPMTLTELVINPAEPASATSLRALDEADLPAEFDSILVYTQGDLPLSDAIKDKLLGFVRGGGGLVGLHCAADSFPGWAGWDDLLRGRFEHHPAFGDIVVAVCAKDHPVVAGLPPEWILKDEFYHLKDCSWDDKQVIMAGTSPEGGDPRPVTWTRDYGAGRVVYTILGHGVETHADARFQQLVAQALSWASRRPVPRPESLVSSLLPQGPAFLELDSVQNFEVKEAAVEGVTELHLTGLDMNSSYVIDRVEESLEGETLVVLVVQSRAREGGTGTLDHRLRVPPSVKQVLFGEKRAPIWPAAR